MLTEIGGNEAVSKEYVADRIAGADPESRIKSLEEHVARLTKEVREYIRAEEVMIAAGVVSKTKVEQAHEIVRDLL